MTKTLRDYQTDLENAVADFNATLAKSIVSPLKPLKIAEALREEQSNYCRVCHRKEEFHNRPHAFELLAIPDGCVCDPGDWIRDLNPVCTGYVRDADGNCKRCRHEEGCHGS